MKRYPNNRMSPAIAIVAAIAAVATMAVAVVLPATMRAQPGLDANVLAKREARPTQVTVTIERVDVAAQPAPAITGGAASMPVASAAIKPGV